MYEWISQNLSNPLVAAIGYVVGLLGSIASIIAVFYIQKNKKRSLAYTISPIRTQIVKAGTASKLSVTHNGRVMTGDIMAAHIAIWNQGHKSIRQADILSPLTITIEKNTPILEASILKTQRNVIGLRLDESKCDQGKLEVTWTILEQRDGGIVQIIYEGSPNLQITAHSTIEEQRNIIDNSLRSLNSREEKYLFLTFFLVCLYAFLETYVGIREHFQNSYFFEKYKIWSIVFPILLIFTTATLYLGVILAVRLVHRARPPFSF